jgi:hypothetical protein
VSARIYRHTDLIENQHLNLLFDQYARIFVEEVCLNVLPINRHRKIRLVILRQERLLVEALELVVVAVRQEWVEVAHPLQGLLVAALVLVEVQHPLQGLLEEVVVLVGVAHPLQGLLEEVVVLVGVAHPSLELVGVEKVLAEVVKTCPASVVKVA